MDRTLMWMIAVIGLAALAGAFLRRMFSLVGIILVATFVSLLALRDAGALTAAIGILGATAGYLFGRSGRLRE